MNDNCPELWDTLLKQAPKGSALMGGAVIDYLLGIPVNDYDIFYSYKPGHNIILPGNWVPSKAKFNDPKWVKEHEEEYLQGIDENGNNPISAVYEYLVDGVHKVQLIGVNYDNPINHMKNFDHSLTLASYNSKGMFVSRKVFESVKNRTIEYVSKNLDEITRDKSFLRAQKKAARMPVEEGKWIFKGFNPPVAAPPPVKKMEWFDIG